MFAKILKFNDETTEIIARPNRKKKESSVDAMIAPAKYTIKVESGETRWEKPRRNYSDIKRRD